MLNNRNREGLRNVRAYIGIYCIRWNFSMIAITLIYLTLMFPNALLELISEKDEIYRMFIKGNCKLRPE